MAKRKSISAGHTSVFYGLASVVLVFAVLYVAKPVLVPLSLSVLLTFILTPAVIKLEKWHTPRIPAVLAVTLATLGLLFFVIWMTGSQLQSLASELPNHESEIKRKVAALKLDENSTMRKLNKMAEEVSDDLTEKKGPEEESEKRKDLTSSFNPLTYFKEPPPDKVKLEPRTVVVAAAKTPWKSVFETLTPIVEPIATGSLVVVLVVFLLINREDVRFRALSLWGERSLTGTTRLLSDASTRVSNYLLNLFMVNAAFGIWFGVGLYFIGVPYAPLWGFLTLVLRFIPFLGSPASVLFPLLISIATSTGWTEPILVMVFFGVSELFVANVVEPILFGRTTGLSPIALLVAALFWAWIWGPIGLLLTTPLTVCMVVLGQHIPSLHWLKVLLAEQSEMEPWLQYYQRLLAKDSHEAAALLKKKSDQLGLDGAFDEVVIPALAWTRSERQSDDIDADEARFVWATTRELLDGHQSKQLAELELDKQKETAANQNEAREPESPSIGETSLDQRDQKSISTATIIGYPAHHESEELALAMLAQILPEDLVLEISSTRTMPKTVLQQIEEERPDAVVIAVIPPGGLPQVEFFAEECKRRTPETQIIVAYLGEVEDYDRLLVELRKVGVSYLTTSLGQTSIQLSSIVATSKNLTAAHESKPRVPPPKRFATFAATQ